MGLFVRVDFAAGFLELADLLLFGVVEAGGVFSFDFSGAVFACGASVVFDCCERSGRSCGAAEGAVASDPMVMGRAPLVLSTGVGGVSAET